MANNHSNYNGNGNRNNMNCTETLRDMRQQIALANAHQMLGKITVNCFKKCIDKPGRSLARSEERCLVQCMDRFLDSLKVVSLTYSRRIVRSRSNS